MKRHSEIRPHTHAKLRTPFLLAALTALLVTACASVEPAGSMTLEQKLQKQSYALGAPIERIRDYRITGWNSIDNEHLIIHTGPSDSYLLTLQSPCHNLRTAEDIAVSTTVGSLTRLDKVIVRSQPRGYTEHCVIVAMNSLRKLPSDSPAA